MDVNVFISLLGSLILFANRVAEGVKRSIKIKYPSISEEWVSLITLITSFLAALFGAFAFNLNLLSILPPNQYTARIPEVFGIIVIAAFAAFGSEAAHWLLDLLAAFSERVEPRDTGTFTQKSETTFTAPKPVSTPEGVVAEVTTPAGSATITSPSPAAPTLPPDVHG